MTSVKAGCAGPGERTPDSPGAVPPRKPKKLPRTLTEEEQELLLARPNLAAPTGLRNRAMIELMLRCGLRASEVCGVHLRDVDWRASQIRVRPEVAKGGREAMIYMEPETRAMLERWRDTRRGYAKGAPWLFVTLVGTQLDRRYVWKMVSRYARKAGIPGNVWPHALRHSYATDLLRSGDFTIREVQDLMRHADVRTTAAYTHVYSDELARKVRNRKR